MYKVLASIFVVSQFKTSCSLPSKGLRRMKALSSLLVDGDVFGISKVTVYRLPQSIFRNVTAGTELMQIANWVNKKEHTHHCINTLLICILMLRVMTHIERLTRVSTYENTQCLLCLPFIQGPTEVLHPRESMPCL